MDIVGVVITTVGSIIVALITVGLPLMVKVKHEVRAANNESRDDILKAVAGVKADVAGNSRLTVATARAKLEDIYQRYKDKKVLPQKTWLLVCELHEAYKSVTIDGHTPNSWADSLYEEMEKWEKQ